MIDTPDSSSLFIIIGVPSVPTNKLKNVENFKNSVRKLSKSDEILRKAEDI